MFDLVLQGYVRAMKCEHCELETLLHDLNRALDEADLRNWPQEAMVKVGEHLNTLEEALTAHFRREEEGGFLEDAEVALPRMSGAVSELLKEHGEMLVEVRELAAQTKHMRWGTYHSWRAFLENVRAFVKKLQAHEARENVLLAEAFNDASVA